MKETKSLLIPSDLNKLAEVDLFVENITEDLKFSRDERDDIAISISEAINNAIMHGNQNDISKNITLTFNTLDNGLEIIVQDEGEGFDIKSLPDPTAPENLMDTAGRGLLIIRHLMDKFEISQVKNGTRLTLVKYYSDLK